VKHRKACLYKRMYAVSLERVGIIAGTMCYSRGAAIDCFLNGAAPKEWEKYKAAGYRTVMARIEVIRRHTPFSLQHPREGQP
jgi:hypothetical protein